MAKKKASRKKVASDRVLQAKWPASNPVEHSTEVLVPYARNARTHTKAQVAKIAASIKEWGWTNPVLIDEMGMIIAGHGRVLAANLLGIEVVPCIVADGWTEAQKRAYVIADNKIAEDAGWDSDLLRLELTELGDLGFDLDLTGFDGSELKGLMRGDELADDGTAPPLPDVATSELGDIWQLGSHRVACGDSTDPATVKALLSSGAKPGIMVTDPPYGVDYKPSWRNDAGVSNSKRMGRVENDDRVNWVAAWNLFPGDVVYVWHAGLHAGEVGRNLQESGFDLRSQVIWKKDRFALSRGNYHWHHEPCWYGVRQGKKASWIGGRKESTVWEIDGSNKAGETKTIHSTQKPLECMGRPMRNHDFGEVYDPFLGSGSTLIAAHKQDRVCYGIDIDPRYVDVAIMRWQELTGEDAFHGVTGEIFADVQRRRAAAPRKKKAKKRGSKKSAKRGAKKSDGATARKAARKAARKSAGRRDGGD